VNRSSALALANPATDMSFSPTLSTVSIMPGIDTGAPDRTETSRGSTGAPSTLPLACCNPSRCSSISVQSPSGSVPIVRYGLAKPRQPAVSFLACAQHQTSTAAASYLPCEMRSMTLPPA
jgi:hypothetical protein